MRSRRFRWTTGYGPRLVIVEPRKPERSGTVVGLDLSLTASAACALPLDWDQDLDAVRMSSPIGYKLTNEATQRERLERSIAIADELLAFCRNVQARAVYVEDHSFGSAGAAAAMTKEMTGIVKLRLYEDWGVAPIPVPSASARKTMLQKLPRSDIKAWVVGNVRRLKGPALAWTVDQIDAFVISNHGLMKEGGVAMTFDGSKLK